jgi:hypothetical protein
VDESHLQQQRTGIARLTVFDIRNLTTQTPKKQASILNCSVLLGVLLYPAVQDGVLLGKMYMSMTGV